MLQSCNLIVSSANVSATLLGPVSSGHEALVVGARLYGGANGATVTLVKNNGNADVFTEAYTLGAGEVLQIDAKSAFPAGYSWKAQADAAGIQIDVCADVVEV